jgi:hypothetical protein
VLGGNGAHVVVASYGRWAIESALIDLALRQTGLPCVDPLAPDGA